MTTRLIAVTTQPVTLLDAKLHLRVDVPDDDDLITALIAAASDLAGQHTGRSIAASEWELKLDAFPCAEIRLLWPPVIAVQSVSYIDADGAAQTLSDTLYVLDAHSEPGWLLPAVDTEWPDTYDTAHAVTVRYTAGYGDACPDALRQWMLLQIGHLYRNRESAGDKGAAPLAYIDGLLDRYRVWGA